MVHPSPAPLQPLKLSAQIYASLTEYKDRINKPADFSADGFAEIYNGHMRVLAAISNKSARAYHRKLERIFTAAQWATLVFSFCMSTDGLRAGMVGVTRLLARMLQLKSSMTLIWTA